MREIIADYVDRQGNLPEPVKPVRSSSSFRRPYRDPVTGRAPWQEPPPEPEPVPEPPKRVEYGDFVVEEVEPAGKMPRKFRPGEFNR